MELNIDVKNNIQDFRLSYEDIFGLEYEMQKRFGIENFSKSNTEVSDFKTIYFETKGSDPIDSAKQVNVANLTKITWNEALSLIDDLTNRFIAILSIDPTMGLILTIFLILSFVKKLRKMSTISLTTSEAIIIWIFYKSDSRILTHEELSNKIIDFYNKNEMKKAVDLDTPLNNLINLKCITINSENSEYILNEKVIMK